MTNSEITSNAREKLTGKWLPAIIAFLITSILSSFNLFTEDHLNLPLTIPFSFLDTDQYEEIVNSVHFNLGYLSNILLGGAFAFGQALFGLQLIRKNNAEIELIFGGFKDLNRYFVFLAAHLIISIFTLLWMLLLIIPGIVAALSYSMTFYILVDHPNLGSLDAIERSKLLMKGHKWQLFKLYMRFIALGLLCILTLGIGFLWLIPYANICLSQFYIQLIESTPNAEV
ncbi:MAG: hypothetical protein RJA76_2202 [Bacteroidota bacterium]|jgi:uncharacterized membrane protein